jgi:heterodisulfide reductase subunit A
MAQLAGARVYHNRILIKVKRMPELDVSGQEPRVGVFVCDFGINIRGTVNCPWAVEYTKTLLNVVHSEEGECICSADFQ